VLLPEEERALTETKPGLRLVELGSTVSRKIPYGIVEIQLS